MDIQKIFQRFYQNFINKVQVINVIIKYRADMGLLVFFSSWLIMHTVIADNYQANGWQCQPKADGTWNCAASGGALAPKLDANNQTIPQPEAAIIIEKPHFPVADFSTPNNSPTGGGISVQPKIEDSTQPVTATIITAPTITDPIITDTIETSSMVVPDMAAGVALVNQNILPIESKWSSCAVQPVAEYNENSSLNTNENTNIEADAADTPNSEQINFQGNVIITKNNQQLLADKASYNKTSTVFDAEGHVVIKQNNVIFKGDSARYQSDERKGRLDNAQYQLPTRPAQGTADNIRFKPGNISLQNPTYSTCPADDLDWQISATSMELYLEEGYGEAEGAVMRFKGVPIAYMPYINFPLNDQRKSGFLMPTIGVSDENGFELSTPYYFNIAPDQDATITPTVLSERGVMLGGQYRYLSEQYAGEIYAEWLNDDHYNDRRDIADIVIREGINDIEDVDLKGNAKPHDIARDRGAYSIQQRANWDNGWSGRVDYNYVSDRYYLDDFGNNLRNKSETQLLREGAVYYQNGLVNFMARAQGYQELQKATHTYSRLPQLTLSTNPVFLPYGLVTAFNSEFVRFEENWDSTIEGQVEASRLNMRPQLALPWGNSYSYIVPKVSLDMVTYQLDNEDTAPIRSVNWDDDSPSRVAPIFSVNSGLFFDREFSLMNLPMLQTLEPRLFYLNTPEKDQSDIPLFDTSISTFSFSQLFRENRFSGADRLADANQLTAALTSRMISDATGVELFTASIGQIYYFEDREVTLGYDRNGDPIQSQKDLDSSSSVAAEITSRFAPNWYTSYSLLYDPHNDSGTTEESRYRLQFKSDQYHLANLDYSYRANDYEQTELSTYWKITSKWQALAHWYYSFYDIRALGENVRDGYTLDSKIGLEYNSCCYALSVVVGREQNNYYADADNYMMLRIQFKGLGTFTQSLTGGGINLEEDIPGYQAWDN
jgi:LPS-assembly protein